MDECDGCREQGKKLEDLTAEVSVMKLQLTKFLSAMHDTYEVIGECYTHLSMDAEK